MAKVKGPLFSVGASGGYAGRLEFRQTAHGPVVTRPHAPGSVNPVDPSQAQLDVRARYGAAVQAWRLLDSSAREQYNADARVHAISGWNLFLREYEVVTSGSVGPLQVSSNARDGQEAAQIGWAIDGHDSDGSKLGEGQYDVGLSWVGVNVPVGVTVTNAWVEVYNKWKTGSMELDLVVKGFAVDDVAEFAVGYRPSMIQKTVAELPYDFGSADYVAQSWYRINGLAAIVQEIVGRPGWVEGASLGVVIEDRREASIGRLQIQDFSRQQQFAARIRIEWG